MGCGRIHCFVHSPIIVWRKDGVGRPVFLKHRFRCIQSHVINIVKVDTRRCTVATQASISSASIGCVVPVLVDRTDSLLPALGDQRFCGSGDDMQLTVMGFEFCIQSVELLPQERQALTGRRPAVHENSICVEHRDDFACRGGGLQSPIIGQAQVSSKYEQGSFGYRQTSSPFGVNSARQRVVIKVFVRRQSLDQKNPAGSLHYL